jgi:O-antigen/teichoic acid export membrane protein
MKVIPNKRGAFVLYNSILERGVFFFAYILIARWFSKPEYGLIITIFAFTNILQAFFDLGLPFYIQRETASELEIKKKINSISFLKVISLPLFVLISLIYFINLIQIHLILILVICFITFGWGISNIINSVLYGYDEYKKAALFLSISRMILLGTFILFLSFNAQPEILLLSFVFSIGVHISLFNKFLLTKNIKLLAYIDYKFIFNMLKTSLPMGMGVIFVIIYDRVDILILQKINGLEVVAIYSVAYSLYRALQIFGSMVLIPKYTQFSKHFYSTKGLYLYQIKKTIISLILIVITCTALCYLFSNEIVEILYSSKYLNSGMVLKYLSVGFGGVILNNFTGVILNSIQKEKIPAVTTGVGAIFNIIFNILLIPKIGIWGAVISTIFTEYLVFVSQLVFLLRFRKAKLFALN